MINPLATQEGPSLTAIEAEELRRSPFAIQLLVDLYDVRWAEADAIGEPETAEIARRLEERRKVLAAWRDELRVAGGKPRGDISLVEAREALRAALASLTPEQQAMVDAIVDALPASSTPEALHERMKAAAASAKKHLHNARWKALLSAGLCVEDALGEDPGVDRDALLRLIANEFIYVAAFFVRALKRRAGEEISPARFALVAYGIAEAYAKEPWPEEIAPDICGDGGSLRQILLEQAGEEPAPPGRRPSKHLRVPLGPMSREELERHCTAMMDDRDGFYEIAERRRDEIERLRQEAEQYDSAIAARDLQIEQRTAERDRLHRQLLQHAEVCTESAYPLGERLTGPDEIDRLRNWIADLQSGMYINCVYCGHRYGPGESTPATMAEALKAHIEICPDHPMSSLKAKHERALELLRLARQYMLGSYPESQHEAEAREALIQEIEKAAPPPPPPAPPPEDCGKEFSPGRFCGSTKGHRGDCDDLPF